MFDKARCRNASRGGFTYLRVAAGGVLGVVQGWVEGFGFQASGSSISRSSFEEHSLDELDKGGALIHDSRKRLH